MHTKALLVIEDNPLLTKMYRVAFEDAGFGFFSASDGTTGLALAREKHPDLIILDLLMPGMDGVTVLKKLREDRTTAHIPVIVATAAQKEGDAELLKRMGVVDFFSKPDTTLADLARRVSLHIDTTGS